jgi:hypothetical protein
MSFRCRMRIHKWENPVKVRDDSIATASGMFTVLAAYRFKYTCARCGIDSDEFYGHRRTEPTE